MGYVFVKPGDFLISIWLNVMLVWWQRHFDVVSYLFKVSVNSLVPIPPNSVVTCHPPVDPRSLRTPSTLPGPRCEDARRRRQIGAIWRCFGTHRVEWDISTFFGWLTVFVLVKAVIASCCYCWDYSNFLPLSACQWFRLIPNPGRHSAMTSSLDPLRPPATAAAAADRCCRRSFFLQILCQWIREPFPVNYYYPGFVGNHRRGF